MFRCCVSYSGSESCQEEGLVVDEFVGVLAREQVEEVGFCNGFSGSPELDMVVVGSGFLRFCVALGFTSWPIIFVLSVLAVLSMV